MEGDYAPEPPAPELPAPAPAPELLALALALGTELTLAAGLALALGLALGVGKPATACEKLPVKMYAASPVLVFENALNEPTPRAALGSELVDTVKVSL